MWPLGYILGSDYSPLYLELQYPNINWRDSFEDLLALESGKKMISAVSRQKEAVTANRILIESVREDISQGLTSPAQFFFVQADREQRDNVSGLPCSSQKDSIDLEKYDS